MTGTTNNSESLGGASVSQTVTAYLTSMLHTSETGLPMNWILAALTVSLTGLLYFTTQVRGAGKPQLGRKAQLSKEMKKIYQEIETRNRSGATEQQLTGPKMTITQLYIYPIKSIRGCSLPSATLTREGFSYDRKFMLLKVKDEGSSPRLENMHITYFPSMALFHTSIQDSVLHVKYRSPGSSLDSDLPTIEIPLEPATFSNLKKVEVNMHSSCTTAYDMGANFNDWFSKYFGFKVILAYAGNNRRLVLGNLPRKPAYESPLTKSPIAQVISKLPVIGSLINGQEDEKIAFNDCAPYLIITEKSCAEVSSRLPPETPMDITKFRANVILSGSPSAFDEDYWGGLSFGDDKEIVLTGNCGRCVSLNVDHEKGIAPPKGEGVLKSMMGDRRVDPGMKYSPIFGRYGFVRKSCEGKVLRVGDEVRVSKRNEERTRFCEFLPPNDGSFDADCCIL
ncbi:MOSC domain-containing protein [Rutstroemia sp. NJR-2017a BVV2]|nr:MOSC domain-containing protein [Rutstroemia sp. NJR-2017a BVV2]